MKIIRRLSVLLALALTAATFPADLTLQTTNNTTSELGMVTFADGTSSIQLPVGPSVTEYVPISFAVTRVTVYSQTIVYPSNGPISEPTGGLIYINWPSPNYIEFTNTRISN